jgi:hypothetical protein
VGADQAGQDVTATATAFSETGWVDDTLPVGAQIGGYLNDGWNWVGATPTPFSGALAHQSPVLSGTHQHYFHSASETLLVEPGDTLFAYVYLDPANPPQQLMLQWNDGLGWEHRAYWGEDKIPFGTGDTNGHRYMGELPEVGQWVRLEVPASTVGLDGATLTGMAFALFDGAATWDYAGSFSGAD